MKYRYAFLLPILGGVLCCGLWGQLKYRLPHIANGANAIRTTFILVNSTTTDTTVTLSFFDDSGDPVSINIPGLSAGPAKTLSLGAGESRFLQTDGQGDLVVGSATVLSEDADIGISGIFTILKDGGTAILTEAGISTSQAMSAFALAVNTVGPFNTGLAMANVGKGQATVTFELYGEDGVLRGATTRNIPEGGHLAVFVDEVGGLFPQLGDFKGCLRVSATGPVSALTLRQNSARATPLTTLPVVPTRWIIGDESGAETTSFKLPHIANGAAGNNGGIKTQFVIFSLGFSATIDLTLTDDDGADLETTLSTGESGSTFEFELPANGAIFTETNGTGALTTGSARIESTAPIGVSAIFSLFDGDGNITVEAGVGKSPVSRDFTIPIDLTSGFNTGLAFQNTSGTDTAHVNFTFFDNSGTGVASFKYRIGPEALVPFGHLAKFITELKDAGSISNTTGQLAVSSDVELAAVGLRQGPSTLTTLPVLTDLFDGLAGADPDPGNLLPKTLTGIDLTSNLAQNIQLDAGYELKGRLTLESGSDVTSRITAVDGSGHSYAGIFTSELGDFSIIVPKGTYDLGFCTELNVAFASAGGKGSSLASRFVPLQAGEPYYTIVTHLEPGVAVEGETTHDLTIPNPETVGVTGTLSDTGKLPAGVFPTGTALYLVANDSATQSIASINSNGSFTAALAPGSYRANLLFGEVVDDVTFNGFGIVQDIGTFDVGPGGASGLNFSVPDLVVVSGQVKQPQTANFARSQAGATNLKFPTFRSFHQCLPVQSLGFSGTNVFASGAYSLVVPRGETYTYFASLGAPGIPGDSTEIVSPLLGANPHSFDADANLDLQVPTLPQPVTISGKVTGPDGAPVPDASIEATGSGGLVGAPNAALLLLQTSTDAQGNYSLTVPAGTNYVVRVDPHSDDFSF